MLKNYLKVTWRNLLRRKGQTAINVVGLSVGLACCLLIFLFVRDELSYDRFHDDADHIYRLINERYHDETGAISETPRTPPALAPTLERTFPEVQEAARLYDMFQQVMTYEGAQFSEENFYLTDPSLLDILSIRLVQGHPETALAEPHTLILSRSMAQKYFDARDPIGEVLTAQGSGEFTVTGVFEDLPEQSHLRVDFLGSFATLDQWMPEEERSNWGWNQFYSYLLLPEGASPEQLEAKLPALLDEHAGLQEDRGFLYGLHLQALTDIRLHSAGMEMDVAGTSDIAYVWAFSAIALFILLIACFNFMNLATARSLQRAKEVGMRKVAGARRSQLVGQFLGESVLLSLGALLLALLLVQLALPFFNDFMGKSLAVDYAGSVGWIAGLLALGVAVGLLAGSYPAFFLSAYRPAQVLKGASEKTGGPALTRLRKGLVTAQFAISIVLLIGTGIVYAQLGYVQTKNLGFAEDQIVVMPLRGELQSSLEAAKAELLRSPLIESASGSWGVPGGMFATDAIRPEGREREFMTTLFTVDHDYLETYGLALAAGRDFSRERPSDAEEGYILNETAVRALGWTPEEALGRQIEWNKWEEGNPVKQGRVIGVVEDFHFESLHRSIGPLVMHIYPPSFGHFSVRLRPENVSAALETLRQHWEGWAPEWPFDYNFLDQDFAAQYEAEQQLGQLFAIFAGLAIFIACLGLFGLAAFAAERRRREIAIRKVLGATARSLVTLLSKDFLKLVLVGFAVAVPLAYYGMRRWLEGFAYHIEIGPGVFALAGGAALTIALLTVSYQALRAAWMNPAEAIKNE